MELSTGSYNQLGLRSGLRSGLRRPRVGLPNGSVGRVMALDFIGRGCTALLNSDDRFSS